MTERIDNNKAETPACSVTIGVSPALQAAYDAYYGPEIAAWRTLGGRYKAENILAVCRGRRFDKVLECGAGDGSILEFLDASGAFKAFWATEISASGIAAILRRHIPRLREARSFNGYALPFADREFDLVVCSHVFEHVEHPRILLRELARVGDWQAFEIPLDYSLGVDRNFKALRRYGHINIFTPSLFRFLLLSEGYEIVAERFTQTALDVVRYNWYKNLNIPPSLVTELRIRTWDWYRRARRWLVGRARYEEFGCAAYTCLARPRRTEAVHGAGDAESGGE